MIIIINGLKYEKLGIVSEISESFTLYESLRTCICGLAEDTWRQS